MTIEEKFKKMSKSPSKNKLKALNTGSAPDIEAFWENVIAPTLPDYDTMKKWHDLLLAYISQSNAVFMIRKGNEESKGYIETVPADALRRGFLTKTTEGYSFVYNDNAFATYMLAMVLDNDVIDSLTAEKLLTYLQTPGATIRFHRSGKGGVEKKKAFFKIDGTQPQISPKGYTVAHIFDVNNHYYAESLGLDNTGGEEALKAPNIGINKGKYSDYPLQATLGGRDIYYRENYLPGADARKFLEAHMLRFLHPLNYFCAPKDNMNGHIYCEFTDHIKNRRFKRISGYEHLLYYAHQKYKEAYGDIYEDFLTRIMLPENPLDFFENSHAVADNYGSEKIAIQYGNPLYVAIDSGGVNTVVSPTKTTKTAKKKGRTTMASANEFKDFEKYTQKTGVKNPEYYSSLIRGILAELNIKTLDDLAKHIDEAITHCTKNIEGTNNPKEKKRYSNYRSALRKYKAFFMEMADCMDEKTIFLDELEKYMRAKGLSENAIKIYLDRIRQLLEGTFSVGDLCGAADQLWEDLGPHGQLYDAKDHGNTRAAVKHVSNLVREKILQEQGCPYVSYNVGWDSFRPKDWYESGYTIQGGIITFSYNKGFGASKNIEKKISADDIRTLNDIFSRAHSKGCLASSGTCISTIHGNQNKYDYSFMGHTGNNCCCLFEGDTAYVRKLNDEYEDLIQKQRI